MRIEPSRPVLDLFGYFLGQCQKATRSPQASGSFALEKNLEGQSKELDSGLRRNDERKSGSLPKGDVSSALKKAQGTGFQLSLE